MHSCAGVYMKKEHSHPHGSLLKMKFDLEVIVCTPALLISKMLIPVLMTYMSLG